MEVTGLVKYQSRMGMHENKNSTSGSRSTLGTGGQPTTCCKVNKHHHHQNQNHHHHQNQNHLILATRQRFCCKHLNKKERN
jgi:hypothetical protein